MSRPITRKDLIQLLLVVLIGAGVGQFLSRSTPTGRDVEANRTAQVLLRDMSSPSRAAANATLTLVVFTDYQCPACKRASPAMHAAVAEDGRVRIIYIDMPILGPASELAARVAIASHRQGIYPEVHRRLMDERRRPDTPVLREAVEASGGNWDSIQHILLADADAIDRQLIRNKAHAFALGISGTPAYLAGSRLAVGALDKAGFAQLFALGRKAAAKSHGKGRG